MNEKKQKYRDYFILCARVLIAWNFFSYGFGKLSGGQFGISAAEMATPVQELGLFKLSWYLFDHEPFKSFIGISQIIASLLLLYNPTLIFGALLSVPILANILIVDITYIKMPGFYWRLSFYLILDFLILWHYRERVIPAIRSLVLSLKPRFEYPFWAYLILPVMAIALEMAGTIPRLLTGMLFNPTETWKGLSQIPDLISEVSKQIFR